MKPQESRPINTGARADRTVSLISRTLQLAGTACLCWASLAIAPCMAQASAPAPAPDGGRIAAGTECLPPDCDDGDPCTDDTCVPGQGCEHPYNSNPCDDHNACTSADQCFFGYCSGTPINYCDDYNDCTVDGCDPDVGCTHQPGTPGGPCNDFDPCTIGDTCGEYYCLPGTPIDCSDGDPCTNDSCEFGRGCLNSPSPGIACNADACTIGGYCAARSLFNLTGPQVVPPTSSHALAEGTVTVDPTETLIRLTVRYLVPLQSAAIFMEIHLAQAGANGPTLFLMIGNRPLDTHWYLTAANLYPHPQEGVSTFADAIAKIRAGQTYLDVHTMSFGGGEIRGQIVEGTGASCEGGSPPDCEDHNPCTADSCDPSTGCAHAPVNVGGTCDDHDACTAQDACGTDGVCRGGATVTCNDGNACTDDACEPASGCVSAPNGTCGASPRGQGYWRRLCRGPHSGGEFYTQEDVDCVGNACAMAGIATVSDLCGRLEPAPSSDKCEQAEAQFVALMLNLCRGRLLEQEPIDSLCTESATVGQSRSDADARLCDTHLDDASCTTALCEAEEIDSGRALGVNSLRARRLADGNIELTWAPPYSPDGSAAVAGYRLWRRDPGGSSSTMIAETQSTSFVDAPPDGPLHLYEVTVIW
jgi:hypothetical protein